MTKFVSIIVIKLVTLKAEAKLELLFSELGPETSLHSTEVSLNQHNKV